MKSTFVFISVFFLLLILSGCYQLKIEQGAVFPSKYKNMKFNAEKGVKAKVVHHIHPVYGNTIQLFLFDANDSISSLAQFTKDSTLKTLEHWRYYDHGKTAICISHQKANAYNSITYSKRDDKGYEIEGTQIQVKGRRLSEEIQSKYYLTYFDDYKKTIGRYWTFSNKTDSIEHLRYILNHDAEGVYSGGSTYQFDEQGNVVGMDSTYRKKIDTEYINGSEKHIRQVLINPSGKEYYSKESTFYNSLQQVIVYAVENDGDDPFYNNSTAFFRDEKGRVREIIKTGFDLKIYSEESIKYGYIKSATNDPEQALKDFVEDL
jgi:hypothetical protein